MGLVGLRGREDEPDVRTLLTYAHGSARSTAAAVARYHDGEWILVGWEDEGDLVGCAGLERVSDGEISVRSVAVAPDRWGRGHGRALIEALVDVASARSLVAETDEDTVGFYRRCGFSVEEIAPEGGRARFRDTSDDPDEWSERNPARGQCAVTALLVRDLLGGEILLAGVLGEGRRVERHAWNRLPSGLSLDLTRSQFSNSEQLEDPVVGEPVVMSRERFELLERRVREKLSLHPSGPDRSGPYEPRARAAS